MVSSWGPKTALISGSCTRLHPSSWLQAVFEERGSWDTCPFAFSILTSTLPHPWFKCFSFPRTMLWPLVALRTEGFLFRNRIQMVVRVVLRAACASYCNNHPVIQAAHAVATQSAPCHFCGGNSHVYSGLNWMVPWSLIKGSVNLQESHLKNGFHLKWSPLLFCPPWISLSL